MDLNPASLTSLRSSPFPFTTTAYRQEPELTTHQQAVNPLKKTNDPYTRSRLPTQEEIDAIMIAHPSIRDPQIIKQVLNKYPFLSGGYSRKPTQEEIDAALSDRTIQMPCVHEQHVKYSTLRDTPTELDSNPFSRSGSVFCLRCKKVWSYDRFRSSITTEKDMTPIVDSKRINQLMQTKKATVPKLQSKEQAMDAFMRKQLHI
jgi:hypothetical protein